VVLEQTVAGRRLRCPHTFGMVYDRTHTAVLLLDGFLPRGAGLAAMRALACPQCEEEGSPVLELACGWRSCVACLDALERRLRPLNCLGGNCEAAHYVVLPERGLPARRVCGAPPAGAVAVLADAWRALAIYDDRSFGALEAIFDPVAAVNAISCEYAQARAFTEVRALLRNLTLDDSDSEATTCMDTS
jgi:hypothetical protein